MGSTTTNPSNPENWQHSSKVSFGEPECHRQYHVIRLNSVDPLTFLFVLENSLQLLHIGHDQTANLGDSPCRLCMTPSSLGSYVFIADEDWTTRQVNICNEKAFEINPLNWLLRFIIGEYSTNIMARRIARSVRGIFCNASCRFETKCIFVKYSRKYGVVENAVGNCKKSMVSYSPKTTIDRPGGSNKSVVAMSTQS